MIERTRKHLLAPGNGDDGTQDGGHRRKRGEARAEADAAKRGEVIRMTIRMPKRESTRWGSGPAEEFWGWAKSDLTPALELRMTLSEKLSADSGS